VGALWWFFVGSSLVEVLWWKFSGGSSLVEVLWWKFSGGSSLAGALSARNLFLGLYTFLTSWLSQLFHCFTTEISNT
jgi:hypothetical protein